MINNENKNEIIEQYLLGELDGDLLNEVNHKLATDDKFRTEVALERTIMRNIRAVGRSDYKLKLESFHQDMLEEPELDEPDVEAEQQNTGGKVIKMMTARKYMLMAAASIALIITSTLTLNTFLESGNNPQAIYKAAYSPYPSNGVMRGEADVKTQALAAYDAGDYTESIQLFKQVLQDQKEGTDLHESALFYLGNAYLAANQPEEAITTFKAYLKQYKDYESEVKWYLALSYLKIENEKEAKIFLQELAEATNDEALEYREKANEILDKLD